MKEHRFSLPFTSFGREQCISPMKSFWLTKLSGRSNENAKAPTDVAWHEQHSMRHPREVLHWYDFLCSFCYIGKSRNAVLARHGFHPVELTFQRFTPKFDTTGFQRN